MENLIFKQIPAIMAEIEPIAKGRKNSQQGYSYRGVDDVMNELSPIMAKHKVFIVPVLDEITGTENVTSRSGSAGYHMTRLYKFRLFAEDGSFIEGRVEGEASDFGDKAAGKAHSYAYRDFLMKTFCIPTEGDHDTDKHSPEFTRDETKQENVSEKNWMSAKQLEQLIQRVVVNGELDLIERARQTFKIRKEYNAQLDQLMKGVHPAQMMADVDPDAFEAALNQPEKL